MTDTSKRNEENAKVVRDLFACFHKSDAGWHLITPEMLGKVPSLDDFIQTAQQITLKALDQRDREKDEAVREAARQTAKTIRTRIVLSKPALIAGDQYYWREQYIKECDKFLTTPQEAPQEGLEDSNKEHE